MRGRLIEQLMCRFRTDRSELEAVYGADPALLDRLFARVAVRFDGFVRVTEDGLAILPEGRPLARMIARDFDAYALDKAGHSPAV